MNQNPVPSSLVSADASAIDEALWAPASLFIANWSQQVEITTNWSTTILTSRGGQESRIGLRGKPQRSFTAANVAMDAAELRKLRAANFRAAKARLLVPLYSDATELTAPVTAGSSRTLICSTVDRRFYPGGLVIICHLVGTSEQPKFEVAAATAVAGGSITVAALGNGYPAGARVYPAIECAAIDSINATMESDDVASVSFSASEAVGPSALPGWIRSNVTPDGFDTYGGLPILSLPFQWDGTLAVGVQRLDLKNEVGLTVKSQSKSARPVAKGHVSFVFLNRADAAQLLRFFDSRRGQLFPFILPIPSAEITVISVSGTSLIVPSAGPLSDWQWSPLVAFRLWGDGGYVVRKVDGYVRNGDGTDTLTLDVAVTAAVEAGSFSGCHPAYAVRFDGDSIAESWQTDEVMSTSLSVTEVPFDVASSLEVPDPRGGGEGTADDPGTGPPGDPPPDAGGSYYQLKTCDGTSYTHYYIPTAAAPAAVYNPSSDTWYQVDTSTTVTTLPGDAIVPSGWEAIPGDGTNPAWVPPCPEGGIDPSDPTVYCLYAFSVEYRCDEGEFRAIEGPVFATCGTIGDYVADMSWTQSTGEGTVRCIWTILVKGSPCPDGNSELCTPPSAPSSRPSNPADCPPCDGPP